MEQPKLQTHALSVELLSHMRVCKLLGRLGATFQRLVKLSLCISSHLTGKKLQIRGLIATAALECGTNTGRIAQQQAYFFWSKDSV